MAKRASLVDPIVCHVMAQESCSLFGRVPPELVPLLETGLAALTHDERQTFINAVSRAQSVLRDHCVRAAFATGRARYLAPDTVNGLVNYHQHRILIRSESES